MRRGASAVSRIMPPRVETWLLQFVQLELQMLLQSKQAASQQANFKPFPRGPQYMPFVERKYERRPCGGFKVSCKDNNSRSPPVHVFQILDSGSIVSAQISDAICFLNTKFSHAARASFQKKHSTDLVEMTQGSLIKMLDFELHLTIHGDEAWNVSLLINEFRVAESISCEPPLQYAPLVDIGGVRKMLISLMGHLGNSDALESSAMEVDDDNSTDSDMASQDGLPQKFQSSLASQATFATQATPALQSKRKAYHNVNTLGGVNMSSPQPPRKRLDSFGRPQHPSSAKINSNAHQLLLLLSRKEKAAIVQSSNQKDVEMSNLAAALPDPQLLTSNIISEPTQNTELAPPPQNVISSEPTMGPDYFSTHRGHFDFVKYAGHSNRPDEKQQKLLLDAASWYYPEPAVQCSGSDAPADVSTNFKSLSEVKSTDTVEALDVATPMAVDTNKTFARETPDDMGHIAEETHPASDSEDEIPPLTLSHESQSSSPEQLFEWPTSPPEKVIKNPESLNEPLDSSIESLKRGPSKWKKRSLTPPSPVTNHAKNRRKTQSPPLASHDYDDPALIARRKKRDFVDARRARQTNPEAHYGPVSETLVGDARKFGIESCMSSNSSGRFSPPAVSRSANNTVSESMPLEVRSESISSSLRAIYDTPQDTQAAQSCYVEGTPEWNDVLEEWATKYRVELDGLEMSLAEYNSRPSSWTSYNFWDTYRIQSDANLSRRIKQRQKLRDGSINFNACLGPISDPRIRDKLEKYEDENETARLDPDNAFPYITKTIYSDDTLMFEDKLQYYVGKFFVTLPWPHPALWPRSNSSKEGDSQIPNSTQPQNELAMAAGSNGTAVSTMRNFDKQTAESDSAKVPWWKRDDTVFKRFARDYASLKSLDGSLGQPGKDGLRSLGAGSVDVLGWPL